MARYEMITVEVNVKEGMDALSSLIEALAEMEGEKPDKQKTENEISGKTADQVAKADAGKLRLTLVPPQIIYDIAEVRMYGCVKYPDGGPDNWKRVEAQRYRDAAFRHFLAYLKDPNSVDPESGIKHRKHVECNFSFLAEMEDG